MLIKTEGIIIKTRDYGEGNKILVLYSRELGKTSVMARGAKKPNSRLSSISQAFTHGQYLIYRSSSSNMGTLSQGEIVHSFRDLRQDLMKTSYAAYLSELLNKLTEEKEKNEYLFDLFLELMKLLDDGKDPEILSRLFEIKMLIHGGYRPELNRCVQCGAVEGVFAFSVSEGGFICDQCHHIDPQRIMISKGALKILRMLYHIHPNQLGQINVKEETKKAMRHVLWNFMDYHTPLRLKSRDFLERVREL